MSDRHFRLRPLSGAHLAELEAKAAIDVRLPSKGRPPRCARPRRFRNTTSLRKELHSVRKEERREDVYQADRICLGSNLVEQPKRCDKTGMAAEKDRRRKE